VSETQSDGAIVGTDKGWRASVDRSDTATDRHTVDKIISHFDLLEKNLEFGHALLLGLFRIRRPGRLWSTLRFRRQVLGCAGRCAVGDPRNPLLEIRGEVIDWKEGRGGEGRKSDRAGMQAEFSFTGKR
jgi:hypothetical protein